MLRAGVRSHPASLVPIGPVSEKLSRSANRPIWWLNSKWPTSCWFWPMCLRGFFVRLRMIHVQTDFRACRRNLLLGVRHFKGCGQAIRPHSSMKVIPYVQAWTVNSHVKLQSDWTKYNKVNANFCVLAKHQPSPRRQDDTV